MSGTAAARNHCAGVFTLGGLSTPVTIAGFSGMLGSAVTGITFCGSKAQGAQPRRHQPESLLANNFAARPRLRRRGVANAGLASGAPDTYYRDVCFIGTTELTASMQAGTTRSLSPPGVAARSTFRYADPFGAFHEKAVVSSVTMRPLFSSGPCRS